MELIIKFALVRCMKPKRCSLQVLRMQHTNPKVEKEKNLEFTRKSALDQHHNNSSQMLFFSKENKLILLNEKNLQKLNNKGESKEQEVIPLDNNSSDIKTSTSVFLTANSDKKEVASTSSSETTYSDDEPLDIGQKNLIQRDLNNPSLWYTDEIELRKLPKHYLMLSKSNLTLLVSLTSAAGYGLACTSMSTASFSPSILVLSTVGVALTSASANTINQILEVPFDSQMVRTRNRVLVRGLISPWHAMGFAVASGIGGSAMLWYFVNPLASMLSLFTLILYTSIYTPMKRLSIYNTWVGSIVGAIPPIIGWTSATSQLDVGSLVLAGVLYTWQFPHFNALSWNLRKDYSQAGYRMLSVTDPELCKRVALRYVCLMCKYIKLVRTSEFAIFCGI